MSISTFAIFLILKLICLTLIECGGPIVSIENGEILGSMMKSEKEKDFYSFRKIPYVKPPIGELRFKRPQPPDNWDTVLDATQDGPVCPQMDILHDKKYIGNEDCLHINVYTPKLPSDNEVVSLPVMVFIHGGGYYEGTGISALYSPVLLIDQDVVLVTMNYRIGVLGFLSTSDEILSGNYGIHDQVEALRWVQKNIAKFGGNPDSVTIFGESAGGAAVTLHLISPVSKGLFHGAIPMSGSTICDWALQENPVKYAKLLAIKLGCRADSSKAIRDCIKMKSAEDITLTYDNSFKLFVYTPVRFVPSVDKTPGSVLPDDPNVLLHSGKINRVPTMIGITSEEGALTYSLYANAFDQENEAFLREDLPLLFPLLSDGIEGNSTAVSKFMEDYYLKDIDRKDKIAVRNAVIEFQSDWLMNFCKDKTASFLAQHGVPTYAYNFAYRGTHSITSLFGIKDYIGVAHADDLIYLLATIFKNLKGNDARVADTITTLWANFAYTRNPNGRKNLGFTWYPTQANNPKYLEINLVSEMKNGGLTKHGEIWNKVLPPKRTSSTMKDEL